MENYDEDGSFFHRPISLFVDDVMEMESVKSLPQAETRVYLNLKMDLKTAKKMILMILPKIFANEPVDLITFTMPGKLK